MGLDVVFPKELAQHARSVKQAHDAAMAMARELVGGDSRKLELLDAYDRGFYASLLSTQAAAGNEPVLSVPVSVKDQTRPLLPASASVDLAAVIVDFVVRKMDS